MIRTIVIGHGYLGRFHLEKALLLPECHFVAAVDHNLEAQDYFKKKYPGQKIFSSLNDVRPPFEAALVVASTASHFSLVQELLHRGKHIFCEKPLTSTLSEALKIQSFLQRSDTELVLQVGHSERFHSIWEKKKQFPEFFSDEIPSTICIRRMAPFKKRALATDVVNDLMIHDLDLLLYLFNEWPLKIEAKGYKIKTKNWDFVTVAMEFPSGRKAILTATRHYMQEIRHFEIYNRYGLLHIDLAQKTFQIMKASERETNLETKFSYPAKDLLLEEQRAFYKAVREKSPPPVGVHDGVEAIRLVALILQKLEEGV